jgi:hypothetical protein
MMFYNLLGCPQCGRCPTCGQQTYFQILPNTSPDIWKHQNGFTVSLAPPAGVGPDVRLDDYQPLDDGHGDMGGLLG